MYKIRTTKLFEKSVLKCKRQGKDIDKLKMVVDLLSTGAELSPRYRNHPLKGSVFGYTGCWE